MHLMTATPDARDMQCANANPVQYLQQADRHEAQARETLHLARMSKPGATRRSLANQAREKMRCARLYRNIAVRVQLRILARKAANERY